VERDRQRTSRSSGEHVDPHSFFHERAQKADVTEELDASGTKDSFDRSNGAVLRNRHFSLLISRHIGARWSLVRFRREAEPWVSRAHHMAATRNEVVLNCRI
jgi:hypothetical protein